EYKALPEHSITLETALNKDVLFASWYERNVAAHKKPGYAIVTISVKKTGSPPGDIDSSQMRFVADIADRYSFGDMRIAHTHQLVLRHVEKAKPYDLWQALRSYDLDADNLGLLSDIISGPGGDFCSLANAKSIPVAEAIPPRFTHDALRHIGKVSM